MFDSTAHIDVGNTYYVVAEWDKDGIVGPAGMGYIYINGVLDTSAKVDNPILSDTKNPMYFGQDLRTSANDFTLQDVAFYNHPLSSSGISAHYAAAVPEPSTIMLLCAGALGLVAYGWKKRK